MQDLKDFEINDLKYENIVAERYNRDYHSYPITAYQDDAFAQYVSKHYKKNDRVLDLGCGPASLWPLWEKYLLEYDVLVGIDLSDEMVKVAKLSFPNGDFRQGSIFELPVESGSFDIVIVSSILHHIPDKHLKNAYSEIFRVLDEHGIIIGREPLCTNRITDKGPWFSGAIMDFRHFIYRKFHIRNYPEPNPGEHHHAYDARAFVNEVQNVFHVDEISTKFPFSSFVSRCQNKFLVSISKVFDSMLLGTGGAQLFYKASKNFSSLKDIERSVLNHLKMNEKLDFDEKKFSALLIEAAKEINRISKDKCL